MDSLPEKMLACQVLEYNKPYTIHDVPTPRDLKPHDLLVKVAVASLCHTDGMVTAGTFGTKLPCTASHEGAGTVVAAGPSATGFAPGDRVMCGLFKDVCGVCAECQAPNRMAYCQNNSGAIGVHIDGAFAQYVVCDSRTSAKLPDKVTFATAAPLACAGCTIYRGVVEARLQKGEWLALVGAGGGLGHLGIQFAKAFGLNVIGVDARDEGLALARDVGADLVVDARKGDKAIVAEIGKVTGGRGADATINVSDAKSAAATACAVTKMHGLMVQIAQPDTVDIPFAELVFRDIRIIGSLISSPEQSREMLKVVAEHNVSVKTNVFHGLREIPKLIELAHGGKMQGKGIIAVDQEQLKTEQKLGAKV